MMFSMGGEEKGAPLHENEVDSPRGAGRPKAKRGEGFTSERRPWSDWEVSAGEYAASESARYERGAFSGFG